MGSVYLHIPFCERKCVYCDFYSVETLAHTDGFLEALRTEIRLAAPVWASEQMDTVYFGGGTPSLLEPDELASVLAALHHSFRISPSAEVTVETNPGTVTAEKLSAYRSLGVNRLSIGVQSFHEDELAFLGRIHSVPQSLQCIEDVRRAGFDNVSMDLIYSLPGQTVERWRENLRQTLSIRPEHISAYSLIVEDGTPLARLVGSGVVSPNPSETEAAFYELTMEILGQAGYEHYEVSNYAIPGFRSAHNSAYWNHTGYVGLGPSAHSFRPDGRRGRRWANIANISTYIERLRQTAIPRSFEEEVSAAEMVNERIFLGLRSDGVRLDLLRDEFGVDLRVVRGPIVEGMLDEHLAVDDRGRLKLTPKGFLLCDEIAGRLML